MVNLGTLDGGILTFVSKINIWVVATHIFFIFTPIPGEMIQFDEHIFQMGWNHQLDMDTFYLRVSPYRKHSFGDQHLLPIDVGKYMP